MISLTQRAEAWKLTYARNWKCGQLPQRTKLGELKFPPDAGIEEMEHALRSQFPQATHQRMYDHQEHWFCAGNL